MRTSLVLPSEFPFSLHSSVFFCDFPNSTNPCCALLRSAQQRINQMNKKKAAGNQVLEPPSRPHSLHFYLRARTATFYRLRHRVDVLNLRGTLFQTEIIRRVSSAGQRHDMWTWCSLSPRHRSVSTQLSVLLLLNVAQPYSIFYPGQQAI